MLITNMQNSFSLMFRFEVYKSNNEGFLLRGKQK